MADGAILAHQNDGGRMTERPAAFIVNEQAGTVRTLGPETVKAAIEASLPQWPPGSSVKLLKGAEIEAEVAEVIASRQYGSIVIGGGDGTVSSTAGQLVGTGMALGILPLGTMNLLARALNIELDLGRAIEQLRTAETEAIDIGRVNDRIFVHHVSIGLQPRMVRIRERLGYSSRYTKMLGSIRALLSVVFNAKSLRLGLTIDGESRVLKTPALIISNNVYEDSMWLKPSRMDDGLLGIYAVRDIPFIEYLKLAFDLLRGRWRQNLNVDEWQGRAVKIERLHRYRKPPRHITMTTDGEIVLTDLPITISIDPLGLKVLMPVKQSD
jgi:diacylglycerol kinase family enzyme